jgi:uncharacterized peroxidase-related enzyme
MYLPEVENNPNAASGYAGAIARMREAGAAVPQIMHLLAFKPDAARHLSEFSQAVMRGPSPLDAGLRELIAAFTSEVNDCPFCIHSHAAAAAEMLGDEAMVQSVLADYRTAGIPESWRALFGFMEKATRECAAIEQSDADRLHDAGWSDEAIYDAITVCALFNFYNRWVDASGVPAMSNAENRAAGKRIAQHGYIAGRAQSAE